MPNMLERGMRHVRDRLLEHASVAVTYRRGPNSVPLDAVRGRSDVALDDGSGTVIRSDDWIVRPGDLVLDGDRVEPKRGDTIELAVPDSPVQTFMVLDLGGLPLFRLDPTGSALRIHTKRVAST